MKQNIFLFIFIIQFLFNYIYSQFTFKDSLFIGEISTRYSNNNEFERWVTFSSFNLTNRKNQTSSFMLKNWNREIQTDFIIYDKINHLFASIYQPSKIIGDEKKNDYFPMMLLMEYFYNKPPEVVSQCKFQGLKKLKLKIKN
jgi:hypothetical protein